MNSRFSRFAAVALLGMFAAGPARAVSTTGNVVLTATINDLTAKSGTSHYAVAWVTDSSGKFIKTLWKQGSSSFTGGGDWDHCVTWGTAHGTSTAFDGYSSATAGNYNAVVPPAAGNNPIYVKWNCKDANNAVVPDGTYNFYIQYAENITNPKNGPVTSALTWTKGTAATEVYPPDEGTQSITTGNNFTNMSIIWTPVITPPPPPGSAPEIVVEEPAANELADGSAIKDFGTQDIGVAGEAVTFTIRNTGEAVMTGIALSKNGTHAADFVVTSAPATSLAIGASTTFSLVFKPIAAGARTAALHIASNDDDENPFDIQLTGTGTLAPDIAVEQPLGTKLAGGSAVVDCGPGAVGIAGKSVVFTIWNSGSADLTGIKLSLTGSNASDFKVTGPAATTLKPRSSAVFTVVFKPTAVGTRTAGIAIASNDADENPFVITLTGAASLPAPEIVVAQPAGSGLVDGKAKKSFGTVKVGKAGVAKIFTIRNAGTAKLTGLSVSKDGANKKDFIITGPAKTSLAPGGYTTFQVKFAPAAAGTRNAAIHIRSNDKDESPFDIKLTGAAVK